MIDLKLKEYNALSMRMSLDFGMAIVDEALQNGADRRLLRWRVGAAQAWSMFACALSISINPSPVTAYLDTGAVYENGMFCGIPYAVDRTMPDDVVVLEKLEPMLIAQVKGLAVSHWRSGGK